MKKYWIVVANNAQARFFEEGGRAGSLEEFANLDHPEGRMKAQDLDADRPGRSFESAGALRHGMTREVDAKKQHVLGFARELARRLDDARRKGELQRLILVAAPEFLGMVRQELSPETAALLEQSFDLDLCTLRPDQIRSHLPEKLFMTLG